jgi:hypothetical protein
MQEMRVNIKKFDMRRTMYRPEDNKAPTIVLLGKRDTGKSFLVRDLLYYHQHIPVCTVISATEEGNGFYGKMIPRMMIHNEFNPSILESVLKQQRSIVTQMVKDVEMYGRTNIDPRACLLMDDCLYDDSWAKDRLMRLIFMNGRHWKLMLIITMQYPLGIPPILRTNIDYVFILRENITNNRRRIYENYAGMFHTFEAFCEVMNQCTENFECLVIANNAKSNKLFDQVFWYKASPHDDFRIGSQELWDRSRELDEEESNYNPAMLARRSKGPRLQVHKK